MKWQWFVLGATAPYIIFVVVYVIVAAACLARNDTKGKKLMGVKHDD